MAETNPPFNRIHMQVSKLRILWLGASSLLQSQACFWNKDENVWLKLAANVRLVKSHKELLIILDLR